MNARKQLIALSIINHGNWDRILSDLQTQTYIPDDHVEELCSRIHCGVLTIFDANYPQYLKNCFKPPFALFYYGDLSLIADNSKNIAVVGSRHPSAIGLENTDEFVKGLSKEFTIVSGMAAGIDRQAHLSAIKSGGKTIAVLGSGLDICYPSDNEDIYKDIKENHLLISEYPGNELPNSENFPHRNRLIAIFSVATLVPEAKRRSGTSITVNYTIDFGHQLFCVPSSFLKDSLCNDLIHDGAILARSYDDILYELGK